MTDQDIRDTTATASTGDHASPARWPFWVWAAATLGFLAYVIFGSVEIRLWRFGRLTFEDRRITHVWSYFGDRVPDLPGGGAIDALYWVSLAMMVLATIVGLWLILVDRPETGPHHRNPKNQPTPHGD
jgi:hypothetical protein